jgi:hypothetical protein
VKQHAFTPTISRKIISIQCLADLRLMVDSSENGVLERLRIYLANNAPRPVFYELAGNSKVATLSLFEKLLPDIVDKIKRNHSEKTRFTILATIEAFLFNRVNILRAADFSKHISTLSRVFSSMDRPFIAFLVLTVDIEALKWYRNTPHVNNFAVDRALLMLPQDQQLSVAKTLFGNIIPARHNTKLLKRIFRDAENIALCDFLIHECDFNPLDHSNCFRSARFALSHPKWDYFRQIYGSSLVDDGYLLTDQTIIPQSGRHIKLPFEMSEVREDEWVSYSLAYGRFFMAKYEELTSKQN